MHKNLIFTFVLICSGANAQIAYFTDDPYFLGQYGLSARSAIASNYIVNGISYSNKSPSVQAGFTLNYSRFFKLAVTGNSVYLQDFNTNLSLTSAASPGTELKTELSYSQNFGLDWQSAEIALLRYNYLNHKRLDFSRAHLRYQLHLGHFHLHPFVQFERELTAAPVCNSVTTNATDDTLTCTGYGYKKRNGFAVGVDANFPKVTLSAKIGNWAMMGRYLQAKLCIPFGPYRFEYILSKHTDTAIMHKKTTHQQAIRLQYQPNNNSHDDFNPQFKVYD